MKDSAEDGDIVAAPVLPFRLRLAAALVRMAARWLRAAHSFATVAAVGDAPDAEALTATAAGAKAAAASATDAGAGPEDGHQVNVTLDALMTDVSELVSHLDIRAEIALAPDIDGGLLRSIDLMAVVERLPKLCFALAEFGGGGPATLSLAKDPKGGPDDLVLAATMANGPSAGPIELARIAFAAPKAGGDYGAMPMTFGAQPAAAPAPPAKAPAPAAKAAPRSTEGEGLAALDTPWIAMVERSPAARMILEDLANGLPLATQVAERADEIDDAALSDPMLRGVLFDPGERGVDWQGLVSRIAAANGGAVKPIAMTRCSTAQGEAYKRAGFAMVIE